MFSYLSSFVYSAQEKPTGEQILTTLWYCTKTERVIKIVNKMTKINQKTPLMFMQQLSEEKVSSNTHKIIKEILTLYNAPKWGVCKYIADLMNDKTPCIAAACAIAIGSEKSKWNKKFYHKIRVLKGMEMSEWRKFLKEIKRKENYVIKEQSEKIKKYSLGLFDEPLHACALNTSGQDVPILSVYKNKLYKNTHCRSPIEIPLETPFEQKDFHLFIGEKKDEPLVIVTQYIGKNVVPPEGIYLCFIKDTESYSKGIYPYISGIHNSTLRNFFDFC
jgi:hypothetical protein